MVTISGDPKQFTRPAESGGMIHNYFCPDCGSTVYWTAENLPGMIGVAVGALSDRAYPAPARSIFERSKQDWLHIDGAVEHFPEGSAARSQS
jgi:hypothetical protein